MVFDARTGPMVVFGELMREVYWHYALMRVLRGLFEIHLKVEVLVAPQSVVGTMAVK